MSFLICWALAGFMIFDLGMSKAPVTDNDNYSDAETERRMNAGLKRALNTPHKPHKPPVKKPPKKPIV